MSSQGTSLVAFACSVIDGMCLVLGSSFPELQLEELLTNFELFSVFAEFLHEHLSHEVP